MTHRIWVGQDDYEGTPWFKKMVAEIRDRYDIRPTQDIAMLKIDAKQRRPEKPRTKWGWSVPWMKTPLINARSESLLSSKTWSKAILERRCIIPASAFYEWQRRDDAAKPVPWEIRRTGTDGFFFAGLWKEGIDKKTGEGVLEATIITQEGNKLLREVHNHGGNAGRQPVFLDDDKIIRWLDPDLKDPGEVMPLLRQIEDGEWTGRMLASIGNDSTHQPPVPIEADIYGNIPGMESGPKPSKKKKS